MDKPNIILITTDQQRFDTIAGLGNETIYTPHLDWLVDEGISMTRCYSSAPICMPARATIMTGLEGYSMGYTGNSIKNYPLPIFPTLPGLLTNNGYQTKAVGKMHFEPVRANYGFEHMELPMDYYREMQRINRSPGMVTGMPKSHGIGENEMEPVISSLTEAETLTHWTVRKSIDFLETRDSTRPFFMWTSFTKPHPPFDPILNYWQLYANRDMEPPVEGDWDGQKEGFMEPTYLLNHAHKMSLDKLKEVKKAYYACITQIDYNLGLLFARLREMNLLENTWIIFTADHGEMLGDHKMGAKSVHLEGSAHIPFLVRPPASPWMEKPLAGKKCDKLTQLSDVFATILAAAEIPIPQKSDGFNVMEYMNSQDERIFFGESIDAFFCVIKGMTKYLWTRNGGQELLFNLSDDPKEQRDLIEKCPELRLEMQLLLVEFLQKNHPELLKDGELCADLTAKRPEELNRWPGFHTTAAETDVLH